MEIIKIGNWTITEEGIKWSGKEEIKYFIGKERITERAQGTKTDMYDWLIHMVERPWLTREDIYALNTAFVYALEYFDIGFLDNMSFVETFELQKEQLEFDNK
jgi:hypothetical protein